MKHFPILLTILASISLVACKSNDTNTETKPDETPLTPEEVKYGKKIEEDLTTPNALSEDNNYRNYYEIFVGSYFDTNGDGIGDLNGVIMKLDYIKEMGYNGIWLMPIFESPSYHKYDVKDYYKIDPKYGTMDDFKNLLLAAHSRGIKVIIDMVVNHASNQNDIFDESANAYEKFKRGIPLTENESKLKDYFVFKDTSTGHGTKMYKVPGKNFYYEGNFSDTMPEFDLSKENTKNYLKDIYKYYIDMGVDGFRLDAVKYFFYREHDKCVEYLNELATYCKSLNPNFYIVGECWDTDKVLEKYYTSAVDSYFNFNVSVTNIMSSPIFCSLDLYGAMKTDYLESQKYLIKQANGHIPAPFLDNHDMNRYSVSNASKTKFFYGLLSMYSGTTFTYYGDEIGTTGAIRRNGTYNADQDVRRHMQWSTISDFGICDDPSGADTIPFVHPSVDIQLEDENSILNYYKKANLLRNQNLTLTKGNILETSSFKEDKPLANLDKSYNSDEISIVINFDEKEHQVYDYSNTKYSKVVGQLVTDTSYYIGDLGNKKVSIPPLGIAIIK